VSDDIERDLRDAFAARAAAVTPRPAAWHELRERTRRPAGPARVAVAAAVATAAAAVVVTVALLDPVPPPVAPPASPPVPSVQVPTPPPSEPAAGQVLDSWSVVAFTSGATAGLGHVWVSGATDDGVLLLRIDPDDGSTAEVALPRGRAEAPALSEDRVWLHLEEEVVGLDPDSLEVVTRVPMGPGFGIGASGDRVWSVDGPGGLARVDPATGTVGQRVALPSPPERVLVLDDGAVVATLPDRGAVVRLDPDGTPGEPVAVGPAPGSLVEGDGLVWVALRDDDELVGLDPATLEEVRRLPVPGTDQDDPFLTYDPDRDAFWVAAGGGSLAQVTADEGRVVEHLELGGWLYAGQPAYLDGSVWYVTHGSREVLRIDPRR
jgi:streptogramin lyase